MIALVTGSVERHVNALLEESTAARESLSRLAGASLGLRLTVPDVELVVRAEAHALRISVESVDAADVVLSGTPLALLALWSRGDVSDFEGSGVALGGDARTLERFVELLRLLLPDGEDLLARATGDVAAHELARIGRAAQAWALRAADAMLSNTAEYLQEEARDLPARAEAEAFFGDVEQLRDDVARAAARVDRLIRGESTARSENGS